MDEILRIAKDIGIDIDEYLGITEEALEMIESDNVGSIYNRKLDITKKYYKITEFDRLRITIVKDLVRLSNEYKKY